MHLKEIELENFKSFGKRTKVPMLQGYTAVTGPNGSGKSNISDAILFVLGPKSSRVIRAGKLTDLIFNGGKAGHPASECKVSLYFDNTDRLIPMDSDVVKLTRLVRKSEDAEGYYSYYYLNDKKTQLNEIESLLGHARISADGYNFVQQGDITKIVQMGNVERRRILDDIAGISRFDDDINRAAKEKQDAEENISKLNIIVDELKKQMKQLESDRECALKYRDMRDKLMLSKAQLAVKKKEEVEREIVSIQKQIAEYEQKKVDLDKKIEEAKAELDATEQSLSDTESKMIEKGGEDAKVLKEKIDQIRLDLARSADAITTSEDHLKILAEESKAYKDEVKKVTKELKTLASKRDEVAGQLAEKNKELESMRAELSERQNVVSESDSKLGGMQEQVDKLVKDITSREDAFRTLAIEQDMLAGKIDRLKSEINELEETKKTYEFDLKDAEWNTKQLTGERKNSSGEIKKLQEEFFAKRNEEKKLLQESQEIEDAIKSLNREYNRLKAEMDAAKMVSEGYTAAVGRIIESRDKGAIKGIHGTVSDLCKVDPKYETALTVAAGNRLQSVIVDDDEVASKCIDILKKDKLGRVTFLPLSKMIEGKARGKAILASKKSLGYAIDLIEFDEKYRAAMWFVLGDTIVVSNLHEARAMMGGIRIVTLEGELVEASGAMTGGTLETKSGKFGVSRKSAIDKVATDLRNATEHSEKIGARLWELKEELTAIEDKLKMNNIDGGGQDAKISSLETRIKECQQKVEGKAAEIDAKGKELSETLDTLDGIKKQLAESESLINELKENRDGLVERIQKAAPKELAQEMKKLETSILEANAEVANLSSQHEIASKQIEFVETRKSELEGSLATCTEQIKEHNSKISENTERQKSLETEFEAHRKIEESMGAEIEKLRKKRDDLYKKKTDCEAAIDKHRTGIDTTHDFILGLKTKQGAAEQALAELIAELEQFAGIDVTKEKIPPLSELKELIQKLEGELNTLGVVNLRAIEDYDEKKARFESIKTEISQLTKQKLNLLKLVEELNEKKKFGLLKVFEAIKENFKRIYTELSNGGDADLILEVPEDPLSGGLIIHARPKNKKDLRLEALSGGEKSLTALSFIFAIQQYQPSPFYLLDEIDMFLDGVNAENVARAIAKNSANAQFIQVSLRKITLKEADHMIGVTVLPNGISQLVMKPNIGDEFTDVEETAAQPQEAGSA